MIRTPHPPAHRSPEDAGADAQLDRALRALGTVQTPSGLHQRTLARLENHALPLQNEEATRLRDTRFRVVQRWLAPLGSASGTAGALSAALLLIALGLGLGLHTPTRPAASAPKPTQEIATAPQSSASLASGAPVTPPASARPSHALAARSSPVLMTATFTSSAPEPDASYAPSQPAPPLPLTAQELLMMRMMRRGQGTEFAQLETVRNPSTAAKDQADFHEFFDPAPVNSQSQTEVQAQPPISVPSSAAAAGESGPQTSSTSQGEPQ